MSLNDAVICLSSSSDSEELDAVCLPSPKQSNVQHGISPSPSNSSEDGYVAPLLERLKKYKSVELPNDRFASQDSVLSSSSTVCAYLKGTLTAVQASSSSSCGASTIQQRLTVETSSKARDSLFSLELSSSDDDNDDTDFVEDHPLSVPTSRFTWLARDAKNRADSSTLTGFCSNADYLPDILDDIDRVDTHICTSSQASSQPSQKSQTLTKSQIKKAEAEIRKAEKKRQHEEGKLEKERQKLEKQIERDQLNSIKPGESVDNMKVIIDGQFLAMPEASDITNVLLESKIQYVLEEQLIPHSITWRRKICERSLGINLQVDERTSEEDEDQALILMTKEQFVEGVYHFTQKRIGKLVVGQSLLESVREFKSLLPAKKITIIGFGMDNYFKKHQNKKNRAYRETVRMAGVETTKANKRQKKITSDMDNVVSRIEVEEALVELQIEEPCNVRLLNTSLEIAETIVTFTKAIADAPYRRENANAGLPFYVANAGIKPVKVDKDGNGLLSVWQRQIQQFNNVSADTAQAIVAGYPSPLSLYKAYQKCKHPEEGEGLLKDIVVRRGYGPLSTTRKIGPELSRRIYMFMTTFDGNLILS